MRKLIGLVMLVGFFSVAGFAQESAPRAEFFGGYQYTRFDGGTNANGWNTSLTGNVNNWFGVAADFSGAYASPSSVSLGSLDFDSSGMCRLLRTRSAVARTSFTELTRSVI